MRPVNILHIINNLEIGGAEKQLLELLSSISKNKYNCMACTVLGSGPLEEKFKAIKVPLKIFRMKHRFDITVGVKLVRFMKQEKIDVVHTYLSSYADILGRFAARMSRIPVIISTYRSVNPWQKKSSIFLKRIADRFTDITICNSRAGKDFLVERDNLDAEKVLVIPNGIDLKKYNNGIDVTKKEDLGIHNDNFVMGIVGRLYPVKGVKYFLKAAHAAIQIKPQAKFILVGDGPERENLEKLAESLEIADNTIFTGYLDDIVEVINIFDVSVVTSLREGMPNFIIESMALSKPVVAFDVGGVSELIEDKKTGILIPPQDTKKLTEAIIDLSQDKTLCLRLGANGRKKIENGFSLDSMVEQIEEVYDKLIEKKIDKIAWRP